MSRKWMGLALALALVVCGAQTIAAQDVKYNALPDTDFSKFKTYKWVPIEGGTKVDSITDTQIKSAVDKQLEAKNLKKTEDENADLYVGYQVAVGQERQWNTYNMGGGWGYGPRWGGGMGTATSSTINVGMIGLDMYDRAAKQLVWRGAASKTIDEKATPEKRQKNLDKAMEKLLKKNFPPPGKK